MARPIKQGLEYFPLDVNMDDKVKLIEAQHGIIGFGIVIKLFQKIYSEGYYSTWTEKDVIIFSNSVNTTIDKIQDIIQDCIKWNLFDENLFQQFNILTSKGIQERYIAATSKRTSVKVDNSYLLIDINERKNVIICGVSDGRKPTSSVVNDVKSTQSKVKESKVKNNKKLMCVTPVEIHGEEPRGAHSEKSGNGEYAEEFIKFWNAYPRKTEKSKAYKAWKARIKQKCSSENMIKAAINYARYCNSEQLEERYIKHGATFVGPNMPYEDYINYSPPNKLQLLGGGGRAVQKISIDHTGYDYDEIEAKLLRNSMERYDETSL